MGGNGAYGMLYGHKITQQEYINARNEFYLFYWFHNNESGRIATRTSRTRMWMSKFISG